MLAPDESPQLCVFCECWKVLAEDARAARDAATETARESAAAAKRLSRMLEATWHVLDERLDVEVLHELTAAVAARLRAGKP